MKNPHHLHPIIIALPIAAALFGGTSLQAAVVATEDFEDKALATLEGQGGGSGFSGTWSVGGTDSRVTVVNSSLSYSNGAVGSSGGNQALQFQWEANETITDGIMSRALSSSLSGTVYLSLLFTDTVNNEAFSIGSPDDFVQWGFDDAGGGNPNATILRRNGELQARSNTAAGNSVGSGAVSVLNQTRMLVFKATQSGGNYNSISLFVDPSSLTEPAADATSTFDSGIAFFSHFVARSAFHELNDTFLIDNIRVGTTWEDVVTAIPEPSAVALLGLASLGLLGFRRKR